MGERSKIRKTRTIREGLMGKQDVNWLWPAVAAFCLVHFTIFSLEFRWPQTRWKRRVYDCAVVCGYPAEADGSPSRILKTRVERAAELWKTGRVRFLILSGGAVGNEFVEAEVMKAYAKDLGVDPEVIRVECQAVSTYHNLKYASEIMKREGWQDCAVVTNRWHLRKADHYARKFGLEHVMCPAADGESRRKAVWRWICTNVHMYVNYYRGYS